MRIEAYRNTGAPAGPPVGPNSYTRTRKLDAKGNAVFNQVLGPFAPIRTTDANLIFELIDMNPLSAGVVAAFATIRLRELLDQRVCIISFFFRSNFSREFLIFSMMSASSLFD